MRNLIESEIYKTIKERFFLLILAIAAILGIITIFLNESLGSTHKVSTITGNAAIISGFSNMSVSLIFCSIFLSNHVGKEFSNRTLSMAITRGFTRREIFISKCISYILFSICLMLMYPSVLTIGTTILHGWGTVITKKVVIDLLMRCFIFILSNISLLTLCVCIEFFVNSNTAALILNIVLIGIGTQILVGISERIEWLNMILKFTPFGRIGLISNNIMNSWEFVYALIVSLIFGFIILCITYRFFSRKDME